MPDQQGHCLPEWKEAKTSFESKTEKKKPSKTFLGMFRLGNSLESILKKLDGVYDGAVKEMNDAEALKQWKSYLKLVDGFDKARRDYKTTLQKAAASEKEESQLAKEITVLSKSLSAIESGARINAITKIQLAEKNVSKAPPPKDKEEKVRQLMIDTAKKTAPALKSGVKNGALFVAKVKADPTPATFNTGIQGAARKLTQNTGNIPKIFDATGDDMGVDTKKVAAITTILNAWGSGSRKVNEDADAKTVLRELGAYAQILAACSVLVKELEAASRNKV